MNTKNKIQEGVAPKFSLKKACQDYYQKLLAQIAHAKEELFAEFKQAFGPEENVLRLALNEAEAIAWQTEYPHLLFPQLATEKAEAAAKWESRQASLKHGGPVSQTTWPVRRIDEGCKSVLDYAHSNLAFA